MPRNEGVTTFDVVPVLPGQLCTLIITDYDEGSNYIVTYASYNHTIWLVCLTGSNPGFRQELHKLRGLGSRLYT